MVGITITISNFPTNKGKILLQEKQIRLIRKRDKYQITKLIITLLVKARELKLRFTRIIHVIVILRAVQKRFLERVRLI